MPTTSQPTTSQPTTSQPTSSITSPSAPGPGSTSTSDFDRRVGRLVELSVGNGHDAFSDVPWDDPEFGVDPEDPRLRLVAFDPLRRTRWYRSLPERDQARVGLQRVAVNLRVGWEFENLLQQGLLARAYRMDNQDAAFPYLHHEVMEESQHTMMFYEFIRRYAPEVHGMPRAQARPADPFVYAVCRRFPTLFYFLVLGGEIPIDMLQRKALREGSLHPLVARITSIHVEEEARHVSYANQELRRRVPALSPLRRRALALVVPMLVGIMARMMVYPSAWLRRANGVPDEDWARARRHPATRRLLAQSVGRLRSLCDELGLLGPSAVLMWKAAGIWEPRRARGA